ncbi:MAG: Hsp70 family protein [Deltaproteobacteria bacterium]|nr:Hsp70 family protein [Deltaproteobacteria bacterium]
MNDPIVGIDLGTSNTVVAHADAAGQVRVLADDAGYKIHPSVVSFHPNGGVVVGAPAKQRKVIDPKNTIFSVKRLIGRTYGSPEVQTAKTRMPYEIKEGTNEQPMIVTRGGEFAVPEISAIVLDHAKNIASRVLPSVGRSVITVPASFTDAQRSATATAGAIAGLTVVRVLNEPTAAALAYGNARNLNQIIAVYDFGGGTFDITILKLADQVYEVLGTAGDTFLGGDDLDERLVDRMVEKFLLENRIDLRSNEVSMMRLRAVAEQTKIELSRRSRAVVRIDEIAYGAKGKPLDLQIEITRDEFVRQVADIIDRTFPVCEEALRFASLDITGINDVILVGGTTKIPYVRDQVSRFFARAPRTDVNPEDAVAMGAALQATALERILRKTPTRPGMPVVKVEPAPTTPQEEDTQTGTHEDTFGGETIPLPEVPVDPADELELLPPGPQPRGAKRQTAGYAARPAGEYSVKRGETATTVDRVDERTPPPQAPPPPPVAQPLARMTKSGMQPRIATSPPVPPAAPSAKTMMIDPGTARDPNPRAGEIGASQPTLVFDPEPSPGATAKGMPPAPNPTQRDLTAPAAPTTARGMASAVPSTTQRGLPIASPPAPPPMPPPRKTAPSSPPPLVPSAPPSAPTMYPASAPTQYPQAVPQQPLASPLTPQPTPLPEVPAAGMLPQTYPVMPKAPAPVVLDVTPRGLGIATVAGYCEELIRRNSRVPAEMKRLFTTSRDQQRSVRILVCQGESRKLDDNVVLGDLRLENLPPRPRGETSIEVTFMLDASGILQVSARDSQTGQEQHATLDLVGAMPEADVAAGRDRLQQLRR